MDQKDSFATMPGAYEVVIAITVVASFLSFLLLLD